jgi:hypothetical protein
MAKSKQEKLVFDVRPWVENLGLQELIEQIGKQRVLEELDVDDILANLPLAKRRELQRRLHAEESSAH